MNIPNRKHIVTLTAAIIGCSDGLAQTSDSSPQIQSCINWSDFITYGQTSLEIQGSPSASDFELYGNLIYRPLLAEDDFYWLGFELYEPVSSVDGEIAASEYYSVPFAAKVDTEFGNVTDYVFNAPLTFADRSKLQGIYNALHISQPYTDSSPSDYVVEESDDLGTFETRYQATIDDISKSKLRYLETSLAASGSMLMEVERILINEDETRFVQDDCWHLSAEGQTDVEVYTVDDLFNLQLNQQMSLERRYDPVPADSKLLQLPLNPEDWEMLPEEYAYPRPERSPLVSGDEFIRVLTSLDLSAMDSASILQFLYDNEEYIPLLKAPISAKVFSDENERRLFLMIGKNDSENSHSLLTNIFIDEEIDGESRFRGLMALKYAEQPLSMDLVEQFFFYSSSSPEGQNEELARSALMTLGIIARNQLDTDFGKQLSNRIALELRSSFDDQIKAALLTSLGNTGDRDQQFVVTDYLGDNNALLRERSAQALAEMPSDRTLTALSSQLGRETNAGAQSAILRAMGSNELQGSQLNQVYEYAKNSPDTEIRLAAIEALGKQVESTPEVETELRDLLRTERTQKNMQAILQSLY